MYHGLSSSSPRGPPPIDVSSPAAAANLGAHVRDHYRAYFTSAHAAGDLRPLVVPYSLLGAFIIPVLYLAIPHTRRPWLYAARYPVMLAIVTFNMAETFGSGSSSANFAVGYAVGLMQAWGVLWSATLLVWMRPQFEGERVAKRKRLVHRRENANLLVDGTGRLEGRSSNGVTPGGSNGNVMSRQSGPKPTSTQKQDIHHDVGVDLTHAPDEDVATSLAEGYEYYWQAFPADESFATRLAWSLDLVMSFRGTGWNWCVPVIPHFAKPEKPLSNSLVDLSSIPRCTRQGYCRYTSKREWLRLRLGPMLLMYLALDALSTLMMKDPYFVLGPEDFAAMNRGKSPSDPTLLILPPVLAALPPSMLTMYRASLCLLAILLAIDLIMGIYQLVEHSVVRPILINLVYHDNTNTLELWRYSSVYGSFTYSVLDRGMAGFWGGWWHQTFRPAFSAPGFWLTHPQQRSWTGLDPHSSASKMITGFLAFAQSGFLHSLGGFTCLPPHTQPWLPPCFFLLCWVGAVVQTVTSALLLEITKPFIATNNEKQLTQEATPFPSPLPRWLRRTGNFGFVFGWLYFIQHFLCDDFARAGVWLLEPVPASPLRAVGLGKPGDSWWRWDAVYWPRWYVGRRWWESGLAF
ncbi:hypothetical protein BD289DRAFT_505143 [Coniella lustricola]|uniref:Wax synthase domain-containing protein n=1 Tax=Coniella lustricola TaxID=2025994 RepID=A0A2T3ABE4_9PEZI|nr:hypothetical protein BD289DRAFT_505143 [Coniella lustricola]